MSRNSSLRRGIIATMPGKWGAATKHIASESASQFHSSISASFRHIICGIGPGLLLNRQFPRGAIKPAEQIERIDINHGQRIYE